jgi:hypothetical protein
MLALNSAADAVEKHASRRAKKIRLFFFMNNV